MLNSNFRFRAIYYYEPANNISHFRHRAPHFFNVVCCKNTPSRYISLQTSIASSRQRRHLFVDGKWWFFHRLSLRKKKRWTFDQKNACSSSRFYQYKKKFISSGSKPIIIGRYQMSQEHFLHVIDNDFDYTVGEDGLVHPLEGEELKGLCNSFLSFIHKSTYSVNAKRYH